MKKISLLIWFALLVGQVRAQTIDTAKTPSKDAQVFWNGVTINEIINNSVLIFEGRILTDSVYLQNPPGDIRTYHKVLVLKHFKGEFKSDTIKVVSFDGRMLLNDNSESDQKAYTKVGDEAVFLVSIMRFGNKDPELYNILYGDGCGFIKVCDKKDVIKEVYEPIEKATGTPRIVLRKNSCEK